MAFTAGHETAYDVTRDDEPLELVRTRLVNSTKPEKILLAGHRGSGKSTELNRLAVDPEISRRYEVVRFSVKDVLDLTDLTYIDLLIVMVVRVAEKVLEDRPGSSKEDVERSARLAAELAKELEGWPNEIQERLSEGSRRFEGELAAGAGINLPPILGFFFRLAARIQVEQLTRSATREVIEPKLSDFLKTLDRFFALANDHLSGLSKRLLILIEDLDKLPEITKAKELFQVKGLYLARPSCSIIFTVPIALHYDPEFRAVAGTFDDSVFLPNVRLYHADRSRGENTSGWEVMRRFVTQRISAELVELAALSEAVKLSGGIFQQLQRLMESACLRALSAGADKITKAEVRDSAADYRAELERVLKADDYEVLESVKKCRQASSEPETLQLLHSTHLVEYRNEDRWCDINPLLERTLERWKGPSSAARTSSP